MSAVGPHTYTSSFGASGAAASQFGSSAPNGIAQDQSTGALYVADTANSRIEKFDATGAFIATWGWGVSDGTSAYQVCTSGCQAGISGAGAGQLATPYFVAVDSSGGPSNGDVYVGDTTNNTVSKFDSAGNYLSTNDGTASGSAFGSLAGIAVNSTGALWAYDTDAQMRKFAQDGSFLTQWNSGFGVNPAGIAVDSGDNVYAVRGFPVVQKFSPSGSNLGQVTDDSNTTGLTVDPATDQLYVDEGTTVERFASSCDPSAGTCPIAETFGSGQITSGTGLAVRGSDARAYVADPGNTEVDVFDAPIIPDVTTGPADNLSGTTATVHGTVNPDGVNVTDCHFDYGLTDTYGQSIPCAETVGSGSSDVAVHAAITGLTPGNIYHYRLVADNGNGPVNGADRSFSLGPSVRGEQANTVSTSSAQLTAVVNPNGDPTTYHFEYGDQGPCDSNPCTSIPLADAPAGSGTSDVPVSRAISGLTPDTTYDFRLVATNPVATVAGPGATFTTYATPPTFDPCANDALRTGNGARLPDCRAYEQASPVDKNGGDVLGTTYGVQAALAGDAITYFSQSGLHAGGNGVGSFPSYVSRRSAGQWTTDNTLPPPSIGNRNGIRGWTPDLRFTFSNAFFFGGNPVAGTGLVARDNSAGSYLTIAPYNPGNPGYFFAGASADDSKIFIEATGAALPVTSGPAPTSTADNLYLYDRDAGSLTLAGVLPDSACATPPCASPSGSFAGPFDWFKGTNPTGLARGGAAQRYFTQEEHAISADGDRAFFTAADTGQIYLRQGLTGASPTSVQVSASQRTSPDPNGPKPAIFAAATSSGSQAFFTSCEKLTDDSTAVSDAANACDGSTEGSDLYSYDTQSGELTDLTVDPADPNGADVKAVFGASDDGSYIYFLANGDLDGGGPATPGDCQGVVTNGGFSGHCSIYVEHGGVATFVAPISQTVHFDFRLDWQPEAQASAIDQIPASRVSATGRALVFASTDQLTAYNNVPPSGACGVAPGNVSRACMEFYRYDAGTQQTTCLTCNPTGAPPTAVPQLASITSGTFSLASPAFLPRNLSADGNRFFFETSEKLVASDTNDGPDCANPNGLGITRCQDVYEWEAPGSGSCAQSSSAFSAQDGGCIYLLSGGTQAKPAFFADASRSGDDAFIYVRDQLVPQDADQLQDIYDASVGGGLPAQHQLPPAACTGEACQGNPTPPPGDPASGSSTFSGPGNQGKDRTPSPGASRHTHKCKKRAKGRKCRKHRQHRSANTTRGGAK
ncbi:MAG: hypothetical protein J2O47_00335 [Acidimicrobiaceae bacterium]|nr:hypothetical protein [Acidimicrobiaceae bacterium]